MSDSVSAGELVLGGFNKVTDISGDGLSFYKPAWTPFNSAVAYDIEAVGNSIADGYFVDFTLTISRGDTGTGGMMIYLGENTSIKPMNQLLNVDVQTVKATRLAIINYDDGSSVTGEEQVKLIYAPEHNGEATYKCLKVNASSSAYGFDGYEIATLTNVKDDAFITYNTNEDAVAAGEVAIADLSETTESEDVTVRAWLEGTDAEALNAAIGGVFTIELDIYGLTV